ADAGTKEDLTADCADTRGSTSFPHPSLSARIRIANGSPHKSSFRIKKQAVSDSDGPPRTERHRMAVNFGLWNMSLTIGRRLQASTHWPARVWQRASDLYKLPGAFVR